MVKEEIAKKYLGQTNIAKNGQKMTILEYRSSRDIDVQFEDGTIVKHKIVSDFKSGLIKNPKLYFNKYIGETKMMNCGLNATIIDYKNSHNITIKFENGIVLNEVHYHCFKKGYVNFNKDKDKEIILENISSCGQKMKIIEFNNFRDITIQFEDGTIKKCKNYDSFKKGFVRNPNFDKTKKYYIEVVTIYGLKAKVIKYDRFDKVKVKFEDGALVDNVNFNKLKKGQIQHPLFIHAHFMSNDYFGYKVSYAFSINGQKYFFAENLKTKAQNILTLKECYKKCFE